MKTAQQSTLSRANCEVRFDTLTRQLYATDASPYQLIPVAVAFPRSAEQAASVIQAAAEAGVAVTPRGAGTGLTGGAVGDGLVIDFARYNRRISGFDRERSTVRVEPGVVLDQLNAYLRPHGFWFGPDVATSSRATLGGMIANNSSGAHVPIYGMTGDHVLSVEAVMPDGRVGRISRDTTDFAELQAKVAAVVTRNAALIDERFPKGLLKHAPGYGLDRYLLEHGNLIKLVSGSEGTLMGICSAELNIVPLPQKKGVGLLFFASVMDAMRATVDLLDLEPVAVEHIDRVLLDQTVGQLAFEPARAYLRLDEEPCEAMLIVEFFDDAEDKLAELARRKIGIRRQCTCNAAEMNLVWDLRKKGLTLLTSIKGSAKPTEGLEDSAVRPEQLPDYVTELNKLFDALGLRASYYGHAASGLLHVRPVVDLNVPEDLAKYRKAGEEVSRLVKEFKGSLCAEHGVGIARTEFLPEQLGLEVLEVMREVKSLFDPNGIMNPGKVIDDGRYRFDTNLRQDPNHHLELPFEPVLGFVKRDDSFLDNLEQCNGCGGCRKDIPTMCPTYIATGEEIMVTRGRANTIRAVLDGRIEGGLNAPELDAALSNCLACKACKTECPSNVDLALMKAELLHARHEKHGLTLREHMLTDVDRLGRLGTLFPSIANTLMEWNLLRQFMDKKIGISAKRPLPPFARERFDYWFNRRNSKPRGTRGRVVLWDDTFVRYYEPNVGISAVAVLEAAGFDVVLPKGRACCGRPAFSGGRLDLAKRLGTHNIDLFTRQDGNEPILFMEPSCWSMFKEDYAELRIHGSEKIAQRCMLFEQFIFELLEREPDALQFAEGFNRVAIHGHCHTKALSDPGVSTRLAQRLPNSNVTALQTGCCGMAGAFGALTAKYDLSVKVAQPLVEQINALTPDTRLVASGTSCRHQIEHLTDADPIHMAELLADALKR
ncbi:MAG: FAD-linked oxidase C-terminal domain-containing protein [FCB group bacterium]|jgi:FAD/FMN-containing dehydrogenase/Fe-S oxidoreductase|nr:FAD-linked oxidase C-terminal domain-containing protein [FCB group bacterium]